MFFTLVILAGCGDASDKGGVLGSAAPPLPAEPPQITTPPIVCTANCDNSGENGGDGGSGSTNETGNSGNENGANGGNSGASGAQYRITSAKDSDASFAPQVIGR
jgi:hypothetical protein